MIRRLWWALTGRHRRVRTTSEIATYALAEFTHTTRRAAVLETEPSLKAIAAMGALGLATAYSVIYKKVGPKIATEVMRQSMEHIGGLCREMCGFSPFTVQMPLPPDDGPAPQAQKPPAPQ